MASRPWRYLTGNVVVCATLWRRATGLMFRWPGADFAYIFPFSRDRRISVTMLFVFYPIDILFLDDDGVVIETKPGLKPFSHYVAKRKARSFIELPAGSIVKFGLSRGVKLRWTSGSLRFRSPNHP
ncbi:MAG: DUF192 domain-containing protein [Candidatus Woesearchaeota archaeon]